jgi:hypothetical protein
MPKGKLSCSGACLPGSRAVLKAAALGKVVGYLCEVCARDDYALRTFLVAAGWLHGWREVRFTLVGPGRGEPLSLLLLAAIEEEKSRASECREQRLSRRLAWAVGGSGGDWV